jgi:outer membrane phospholipase A
VELNLADPTSDYAVNVWLPDQAYYKANYWQGHAEVKYVFPLTIKKQPTQWYAKAYGDFLKTNNQMDRKTIGIAIGIYN